MQVRLNSYILPELLNVKEGKLFETPEQKVVSLKACTEIIVLSFPLIIENTVQFEGAQVLMVNPRNKQRQASWVFKPEWQNR